MPITYQKVQELLGTTPQKGQRIQAGPAGYQEIEDVQTTPEGFTIVRTSPFIVSSTGERQGQGGEFAYFGSQGFVGQSRLQDTPIDFSRSRIGTLGAIADLKFNVPSLPGFIAPPPQNRPVITGPRLGESGAIPVPGVIQQQQPAGGQEFTFDPRFPGERLTLEEHQRRVAALQQPQRQAVLGALTGGTQTSPLPPPQQAQPVTHKVEAGENLSIIARRFGVPVSAITGYRSGNPNLIYPGEVLTIGGQPQTQTPAVGQPGVLQGPSEVKPGPGPWRIGAISPERQWVFTPQGWQTTRGVEGFGPIIPEVQEQPGVQPPVQQPAPQPTPQTSSVAPSSLGVITGQTSPETTGQPSPETLEQIKALQKELTEKRAELEIARKAEERGGKYFSKEELAGGGGPGDTEIEKLKKQMTALEETIAASAAPSTEELATEAQLKNLFASEQLGLEAIRGQPIAMPFLTGQSAAVQRQAALQALPLQTQIANLQAKRAAALDVAKIKAGFREKEFTRLTDIEKETRTATRETQKPFELGPGQARYTYNPVTKRFETTASLPPTPKAESLPTSYEEWSLAGGEKGTGQTYAEFVQRGGDTAWQYDAAIWQWLAGEGAALSDEEKALEIKRSGRNPESFGLYGY